MPGVSIPHGNAALWPPIGIAVNWVLERIPGLNKLEADPDTIQKRFGVIGEPVTIGTVLGFLLGLLGRQSIADSLALAVTVAAVMLLFPRMVGVLMEGLVPISEAIRDFMRTRFRRDVYIGLDAAVLIGFPECIATGLLLVPIVVLLAFILPGNRVLPLADLAIATPFLISMCMPLLKRGNVVRGLIAGAVIFTIGLYISGDLAPIFTAASHWIAWIFAKILTLFGYSY